MRNILLKHISYVLIVLLFVLLPLVPHPFVKILMFRILAFSIFSLSYNLLLGYAGLVSLGHAAFWGIGAFSVGLLEAHGITNNFWFIMIAVILGSAFFGCVFGFLSLRTKGLFFVLINLAFSEILRVLARKLRGFTGGEDGLRGLVAPVGLEGLGLYYFIFLLFVICSFLIYWLVNSRFGYLLKGIRENEPRMQALGYNTWAIKFICFVIAGIFGAIAGSLFTFWNSFVSPEEFGLWITGMAILMVLVGGSNYFVGPIVGTIIIVVLFQVVSSYTTHWTAIAGISMIIVVMFARQGIVGLGDRLWKMGVRTYGSRFSSKD